MTQEELIVIWNFTKMTFCNKEGMEYKHILNQMELYTIEEGYCFLHTSNPYVYQEAIKIKEKLQEVLNDVLKMRGISVEVVIKQEIASDNLQYKVIETPKLDLNEGVEEFDTGLPVNNTFESFVNGENTKFVVQCCHSVVDQILEGKSLNYNPLLIYGDSGLGKTHLVQAVGNELIKNNPQKKVKYLTAEEFNNAYLSAIRKGGLRNTVESAENFRSIYRNLDLIIIDDVQFFEKVFGRGDGSVEEEFFNTFNALVKKEKQMIFVSDRKPKNIKGLSDRIKTRFEQGLNLEIKKPDYTTRLAILQAICEQKGQEIKNPVLEFIAERVTENVRALQGVISLLSAKSDLLHEEINIDLARMVIEEQIEKERSKITIEKIAQVVSSYYNITEEEMLSNKRDNKILLPRQIAMYIMRNELDLILGQVGKYFGKDHSTVINAIKKIEALKDEDIQIKNQIKEIINNIKE